MSCAVDIVRKGSFWPVINRSIGSLVEVTLKASTLLAPKAADESKRLAQSGKALLSFRPFHAARGSLVQGFACADTQNDSFREHETECAEGLRNQGGMLAE